jgi:hypothetical protein
MKRIGLFSSIAALCITLLAGQALAQEGGTMPDWANKGGAFGIGGNTTLGGVNGLNIRTFVTPLFGISATIGFAIESTTTEVGDTKVDRSSTSFRVGLYGSYKLAYWQRGHLSVVFGVDLVTLSESEGDNDASGTDVLIGLGLMGEWFPTQYLSLFLLVGLSIDFIGEDEVVGGGGGPLGSGGSINPNADTSGFTMDLSAQPLGLAGFTVWFK